MGLFALAVTAAFAPAVAADTGLVVSVVRFYRAEVGQTQVAAFIEASPLAGSSLAVRVTDPAGATLWEQQWARPAGGGAVEATEHLRFTVGPGPHEFHVAIRDSLGAVLAVSTTPLDGFGAPPGASDLLLAPLIRFTDPGDSMPRPQEFRRGDLLITASADARVSDGAPELYYLLEAYNGDGGPGTLAMTVRDAAGVVVREAPPAPIQVPVRVAVLTGQLDLSTLSPGRYELRLQLVVDGRLLERAAEFERR